MCAPCFLFVSRKWVISELRCSRRFQSGAKFEAIKVTRPSYFVRIPSYVTLKLPGIPTFTLIISLTYSMDNILINLQYSIKFLAIGVNVTLL